MPRTSKDKCRKVATELVEEADKEPPYDQLSREKVKEVTWKTLQYQERTINQYVEMLEKFGYIEHVVDDMYRIHAPDSGTEFTGRRTRKTVSISQDLVEAADNLGLNLSACLENAIVRKLNAYQDYVGSIVDDVDEQEAEVVYRFVSSDVYRSTDGQELRESIYKSVFGEVDVEHVSRLRAKAYRLAASIGVEEEPEF